MKVVLIRDYNCDIKKGDIINEVMEIPNHYSGIYATSKGTVFVRVHKSYCEQIKPNNDGTNEPRS